MANAEESKNVEFWAVQYAEVAHELRAIQQGMESYAQIHAIEPHSEVKQKLFSRIIDSPEGIQNPGGRVTERTSVLGLRSISPFWKWAAVASVLLLTVSVVTSVVFYNKYSATDKDLSASKELLAREKEHNLAMKHYVDIVQDPYSMPVKLTGQSPMPDATAKIFWMQNSGEVMIDASSLPDAPEGKQYQFWAIVDGTPIDGGMIITNDKGIKFRMQKMKSFGKAQAFAISLEKTGGNLHPTAVVSMGKI